MQPAFVKSVWRAASYVLLLAVCANAVFMLLLFCHRIGEGDSFAMAATGYKGMDYGPVVSHATGNIVFVSFKTGRGDLYLANGTDGAIRQLTQNDVCEGSPAFSPDGKQIVFIKETPQALTINAFKGEVWTMNADGTQARALTHDETDYSYPTFSADGKFVYMYRITPDLKTSHTETFRVATDGNSSPVLLPSRSFRQPANIPKRDRWEADNISSDKKWAVDVSGDDSRVLTLARRGENQAKRKLFVGRAYVAQPGFSRDGRFVFFGEENRNGPLALSKIAIDGSGYQRIAQTR